MVGSNSTLSSTDSSDSTCSVVVSNFGNDVTSDYLKNYLTKELMTDQSEIKLSLLWPIGKSLSGLQSSKKLPFSRLSTNGVVIHFLMKASES